MKLLLGLKKIKRLHALTLRWLIYINHSFVSRDGFYALAKNCYYLSFTKWFKYKTIVLLKVLLEWIQIWYDMVTLVVQNNIQKAEKAEISMNTISFSDSAKPSAFPVG